VSISYVGGDIMTVRKNVSISDGLNRQLKRYKKDYPENPVNISRILQDSLERYLLEENEKRVFERRE